MTPAEWQAVAAVVGLGIVVGGLLLNIVRKLDRIEAIHATVQKLALCQDESEASIQRHEMLLRDHATELQAIQREREATNALRKEWQVWRDQQSDRWHNLGAAIRSLGEALANLKEQITQIDRRRTGQGGQ